MPPIAPELILDEEDEEEVEEVCVTREGRLEGWAEGEDVTDDGLRVGTCILVGWLDG